MQVQRIMIVLVAAGWLLSACTSAASRERDAFDGHDAARVQKLAEAFANMPESAGGETPVAPALKGTLELEQLIRQAEARSPRLAAAYEKWRGAVAGITVATALPDATFSYSEFIRSIETRLGPIERRFMLSQRVPNPGKLVARQEQAAGEASAMRANFEATRLGLRESLLVAYFDLQALDARKAILLELAETLRAIEQIVEARVTANLAPQSALLRVQVEATKLESEAETLEKRRPALTSALAAIVGVSVDKGARAPALPDNLDGDLPDRARLTVYAIDHPSVREEFARVAVAEARVNEAGWMWVPDVTFGLEYQMVGIPDVPKSMRPDGYGEDAVSFTVGLTIPWQFHVNMARGDVARASEQAARFMVDQRRLDMQARLDNQLFAWEDAARLVELYDETVLPKARQTLELVRNDFTADRATLTDVLDAERELLAAELSLINARVNLMKARARIESIVARDLETIE